MVAASNHVLHLCVLYVVTGVCASLFLSLTLTLSNGLGAFEVDLAQDRLHRVLLLGVEHLLLRAHALEEVTGVAAALARLAGSEEAATPCSTEGLGRDARVHGRVMVRSSSLAERVVGRGLQHHRVANGGGQRLDLPRRRCSGPAASLVHIRRSCSHPMTSRCRSGASSSSRHLRRLQLEQDGILIGAGATRWLIRRRPVAVLRALEVVVDVGEEATRVLPRVVGVLQEHHVVHSGSARAVLLALVDLVDGVRELVLRDEVVAVRWALVAVAATGHAA